LRTEGGVVDFRVDKAYVRVESLVLKASLYNGYLLKIAGGSELSVSPSGIFN
jgi:hypothetical protein